MSRARSFIAITAAMCLVAPASAGAKQRTYDIVGGTTTVTLNDAWLSALWAEGGQIGASGGAKVVVIQPKGASPIYKITLPVRRTRSAGISYGTSQGTLGSVDHRGTLTISSAQAGVALNFERPAAQLTSTTSYVGAMLRLPSGSGRTPFLRLGAPQIPNPRKGHVAIVVRDAIYDYTGAGAEWYLDGDDAMIKVPIGTVTMDLKVKRR